MYLNGSLEIGEEGGKIPFHVLNSQKFRYPTHLKQMVSFMFSVSMISVTLSKQIVSKFISLKQMPPPSIELPTQPLQLDVLKSLNMPKIKFLFSHNQMASCYVPDLNE